MVYRKRHLSFLDVGLSGLSSSLLMLLIWQDFDPRVFAIFGVSLGVAELFILLRWRLTIACPECGFDPVLYKRNHEQAAQRVKEQLALRKTDAKYIMSAPLNLPILRKKSQKPSLAAALSASSGKSAPHLKNKATSKEIELQTPMR